MIRAISTVLALAAGADPADSGGGVARAGGPRGLVGAPEPALGGLELYLLAFAVATALLAAVLVVWALWMKRRAKPPADAAFDALARRLGLGKKDREVVRVLAAAHGEAKPIALLVSDSALHTALAEMEAQAGLSGEHVAAARRVVTRLAPAPVA